MFQVIVALTLSDQEEQLSSIAAAMCCWFSLKFLVSFPCHPLSANYEVVVEYYGSKMKLKILTSFSIALFLSPAEPLGEAQEGPCLDENDEGKYVNDCLNDYFLLNSISVID